MKTESIIAIVAAAIAAISLGITLKSNIKSDTERLVKLESKVDDLSGQIGLRGPKGDKGDKGDNIADLKISSYSVTAESGRNSKNTNRHHFCALTESTFNYGGTTGTNKTCSVVKEASGIWKMSASAELNQVVHCKVSCF